MVFWKIKYEVCNLFPGNEGTLLLELEEQKQGKNDAREVVRLGRGVLELVSKKEQYVS